MTFTVGSLCSGYDALSLGLHADGYVTGLVGSNDALRLLGNSNPPQQYAAAWRQLTTTVGRLFAQEVA
jgi:hypothetical protein